jgi:hypothetical protein
VPEDGTRTQGCALDFMRLAGKARGNACFCACRLTFPVGAMGLGGEAVSCESADANSTGGIMVICEAG